MIVTYLDQKKLVAEEITADNIELLKIAIWIDLITPSKEEEKQLETILDIEIPTREEMREIELSSRLYKEDDTLFMTASMVAESDTPDPKLDSVTFILTKKQLITIRYVEPQSFKMVRAHLKKIRKAHCHATDLLIELLDATVDRLADILELVSARLEENSRTIFQPANNSEKLDYRLLLQKIGGNADLSSKARESLVSFNRLITFFGQSAGQKIDDEAQLRLVTISKDISSVSDHAIFIATKVNFLLDATLGMVNIEQNNIIKIFSVAAVIFLPPTLIASIYGMNFHFMPELSWKYGYILAIVLILIAAWLPYKYFKYRKWL